MRTYQICSRLRCTRSLKVSFEFQVCGGSVMNSKLKIPLTHWGRVTRIYVNKLTIIGSDNDLSPGRRQAIIWNNAGILLFWPLGTNFSEILIGNQMFYFRKMHLKMSSAKWRPSCLGLNVLTNYQCGIHSQTLPTISMEIDDFMRGNDYRKVSNIRRTKSQNFNALRLIL